MTEFDDVFRPLATEMLSEFGKSLLVVDPSLDVTDPANPVRAAVEHPAKGLITGFEPRQINETSIQSGDAKILFAAESFSTEPKPDWEVHIGETTADPKWVVVGVETIWSGELQAAYWLHVRHQSD